MRGGDLQVPTAAVEGTTLTGTEEETVALGKVTADAGKGGKDGSAVAVAGAAEEFMVGGKRCAAADDWSCRDDHSGVDSENAEAPPASGEITLVPASFTSA
jgi:hypothetical protein